MQSFWKLLKSAPLSAQFGLVVIVFYSVLAIFAPVIAPYGETEIVGAEYELRAP